MRNLSMAAIENAKMTNDIQFGSAVDATTVEAAPIIPITPALMPLIDALIT